jgi:hypothetical protein
MANIDRFFQDMDGYKESTLPEHLQNIRPEKREFLDIGEIVTLNNRTEDIEIIEKLAITDKKVYDYLGEFTDSSDGIRKRIYFNEKSINEVKKNGGKNK